MSILNVTSLCVHLFSANWVVKRQNRVDKSCFNNKDSVQECCAVAFFLALADRPNHIWGIDITYIQLQHGWLYMTAVLDWYSRYVVSWVLSQTLELEFVLAAVDNALLQAVSEIRNSDQGSHFTNPRYLERL